MLFDHPYMKVAAWHIRNHRGRERDFIVTENRDVTIVFPLTAAGQVVGIRQYYVAKAQPVWTLPTGMVDPGETPLSTARKELLEEAGCTATKFISLGTGIKGKYSSGTLHYYLALGTQAGQPQELEDAEDISVKIFSLQQFSHMLTSGKIPEAWIAVGAYRALEYIKIKQLARN